MHPHGIPVWYLMSFLWLIMHQKHPPVWSCHYITCTMCRAHFSDYKTWSRVLFVEEKRKKKY